MTEGAQPVVVRFGFRSAGVGVLAIIGGSGLLMVSFSAYLTTQGEPAAGVVLCLAMGVLLTAPAVFSVSIMLSRRVVVVLSPDGVEFPWIAVPSVRRWTWAEIEGIVAIERAHEGSRTDYRLELAPSPRARRLRSVPDDRTRLQRYLIRPAGPATFSIWWFTTPSPRVVNRYIYAVAPELGLPLIPPRHRPKGYPWGENRSTGPEE